MPKVRLSALITDIKGKQGGSIWSTNGGGPYFRNNKGRGKNKSQRWNSQLSAFAELAQSWRELSENDRIEWNNAAPNFPTTNAFNEPRNPSGYELYMRLNGTLKAAKGTIRQKPPTPQGTTDFGTPTILGTINDELEVKRGVAISADEGVNIYAGAVVSPGRSFNSAKMKLMLTDTAIGSDLSDILAPYESQYGALPDSGKLYVMIESINMITGESGDIHTAFDIIGSPAVTGIGFMVIGSTFIVT